ncbi:MAG: type II secretion system F family protein [Zoogloeaceae bacterium]|jgi:type IV pilus assembly protein PilC|nr:type II secretion system F family protein [Zoogloeaceae bacterium]
MKHAENRASGASRQTISERDIADFTRQLATMLKAGLPMLRALETMARGQRHASSVHRMLTDIHSTIEGGNPLSAALEKYPRQFDRLYLHLVRAGEHAGALDALLERLAYQKERILALKGRFKSMLYYPALIIIVALGTMAIIFPIRLFLLAVLLLAMLIGGAWWFFTSWKTSRNFRVWVDHRVLDIPVFGKLARNSAIARWSRTMSTAYASGVPLIEATGLLDGATGNHVYDKASCRVQAALERGDTLSRATQAAQVFPDMVLQIIATGESTGELDSMLNKLAEHYEQEVDTSVSAIISLTPSLIIAVLGILVGILLISFYGGDFGNIGIIKALDL